MKNVDLKALLHNLLRPAGIRAIDPERDWLLIAGLFLLALFISAGMNAAAFFSSVSGVAQSVQESHILHAVDTSALRQMFDARAAEASRYDSGYSFIDPSK